MYEQLALNDPKMSGVYYKDAAKAWLSAGDLAKALAAAKNADDSLPENRTELLEYYYHRDLGDVYLKLNEPAAAAEHYEEALAKTKIDGYAKETKKLLEQSRTLASRRGGGKPAATTGTGSSTTTGRASSSAKAEFRPEQGLAVAAPDRRRDHRRHRDPDHRSAQVQALRECERIDRA